MKLQHVHPDIVSRKADFTPTASKDVYVRPNGDVLIIQNPQTAFLIRKDESPVTVM